MSKILVTGANGFVGQHIIRELRDNSHAVLAIGGRDINVSVDEAGVNFISLDLSNAEETHKIDFTDIACVIHLAGLAAVSPSFDDPIKYLQVNACIQINLFEAALKQHVTPKFLIISTGALYDPTADLPLTETSPAVPSSPYAVSKLTQEQLAAYYTKRGFECVIARPFNHIGPGQGPGFIVPDIAQQVIACEKSIQHEVKVGNLDAQRDYTDVRDIARAYRLLLEKGVSGEIYNVCSGTPYSGHDILQGILKASGTQPTITTDPSRIRPADNPIIYGNHAKLTEATGWQPKIALETTLQDVVADWRSRV